MTQVSKPYTFSNGTTADATQVNQDFDTLYSDVDGQLDDTNMKTGGLSKAIATEGVAPSQSIGLPYGIDVFGSTGFVQSGITATKDGTNLNQVNIAAGVAYVLQSSGSANGQLRRLTPTATNYRTSAANSTYYLDLNPDGSYTWGGHSTQTGYVTICTVTSDGSGNVSTVTDMRPLGQMSSATFASTGLTGATAASRYVGATSAAAPTSGTFSVGDFIIDRTGLFWICTVAGTPGTWTPLMQGTNGGGKKQEGSSSTAVTTAGQGNAGSVINFPVQFTSVPKVYIQITNLGTSTNTWAYVVPTNITATGFTPFVGSGVAQTLSYEWMAIGS